MKDLTLNNENKYSFTSFKEKHSAFFSSLWNVSLGIGFLWGFFQWIFSLFETAADGNLIGFFIVFVMQTVIMGFQAIIAACIIFIGLVILLTIPYLVIRGFFK